MENLPNQTDEHWSPFKKIGFRFMVIYFLLYAVNSLFILQPVIKVSISSNPPEVVQFSADRQVLTLR